MPDSVEQSAEVVEFRCFHCGHEARGELAEMTARALTLEEVDLRIAGNVCSGCGVFLCRDDHKQACKAAGVKRKACPACGTDKAWGQRLLSPQITLCGPTDAECVACGKPVEGDVVTIDGYLSMSIVKKSFAASVCFRCGAVCCWEDSKAVGRQCPTCRMLGAFTGFVSPRSAWSEARAERDSALEVLAAHQELRNEKRWKARPAVRSAVASTVREFADEIIEAVFSPPETGLFTADVSSLSGDLLDIARIVALGEADLIGDEVMSRLVARIDTDPDAVRAVGRIAAVTGDDGLVEHMFAALQAGNAVSRACAITFLTGTDDDRVTAALSRSLTDPGSVLLAEIESTTEGMESLWAKELLGRFINPFRIGQKVDPEVTVSNLAAFGLTHRGEQPDTLAILEALRLSDQSDCPYSAKKAFNWLRITAEGQGQSVREAVPAIVDALVSMPERPVDGLASDWVSNARIALIQMREHWQSGDFDRLAASDNVRIRLCAVELMAEFGDPQTRLHLETLAEDPVRKIAKAALKALKSLS